MTAKILVIAGSIRSGSVNMQLAKILTKELTAKGAEATHLDLADYPLPIFNQDDEKPENARALADQFCKADALVLVSPEYNASVTPLMKNALDWVSVVGGASQNGFGPYEDKVCFLASCSPGNGGGIRGLYHLRAVLMNVGAEVITPQLPVPNAQTAFDDEGGLANERSAKIMQDALSALLLAIKRAKAVPRSG